MVDQPLPHADAPGRGHAALALLLFVIAAALLATGVIPGRRNGERTSRALEAQRAQNARLAADIERLTEDIDSTAHDPVVTERILRDEYGMLAEDEYIVR